MGPRTEHARLHVEARQSDHVSDHDAIASQLNRYRPCPVCWGVVDEDDEERHRQAHIARAIAAR